LTACGSFVSVAPETFVVSAVKPAEDGRGWILRGYNLTGEDTEVVIKPWAASKRSTRANLAEEKLAALKPGKDGRVKVRVGGHEILSLRFEK
jgi:alpha-mannosidase